MKTNKWIEGSFVPASDESCGMYEAIPVIDDCLSLSQVYEITCRQAGIELGYTKFDNYSHLFEKCEDGNEMAISVVELADKIREKTYVEVTLEPEIVPHGHIAVKNTVWISLNPLPTL